MNDSAPHRNWLLIVLGATIGLAYGLLIRYGSQIFPQGSLFQVMTLGFLLFLPFAMGFVTIFFIERRRAQPVWIWFLLPWIPVFAAELAMMIALWEGMICIVMLTPIALGASSLGGAAAGLIARYMRRSRETTLV